MAVTPLGTLTIRCPSCSSTQLSKGDTPETEDEGTCANCGERFSLKAKINKLGHTASKAVADAMRKALK